MHSNEFERAFSDFLEDKAYDAASDALFTIVRAAFEAGWREGATASPEKMMLMSRQLLISAEAENALKALKEGRPNEAQQILQRGIDRSDDMLMDFDPNR